jgi:hypothetical protein
MTATLHVGWLRTLAANGEQATAWTPVCEAADRDQCWERLLRVETPATSVERLVLVRGQHPEKRKKPR